MRERGVSHQRGGARHPPTTARTASTAVHARHQSWAVRRLRTAHRMPPPASSTATAAPPMTGVADDEPVSARSGELGLGAGTAGADSEGSSLGSGVPVDGVSDGAGPRGPRPRRSARSASGWARPRTPPPSSLVDGVLPRRPSGRSCGTHDQTAGQSPACRRSPAEQHAQGVCHADRRRRAPAEPPRLGSRTLPPPSVARGGGRHPRGHLAPVPVPNSAAGPGPGRGGRTGRRCRPGSTDAAGPRRPLPRHASSSVRLTRRQGSRPGTSAIIARHGSLAAMDRDAKTGSGRTRTR
ncbi:hypothetical protein SBADM41S_09504 [Streptomyces badius]